MTRALRLLGAGLYVAAGYGICALVYPLVPGRVRVRLRQRWARGVLKLLGVRLRVDPLDIAPGSLVVANHVSWLDAVVLQGLLDAAIIAKSETRRWPLLGFMLAQNDTLFIERRVGRALLRVNATIAARLARGGVVIVFPEGTTTEGADVRAFRTALFQPAVAAGRPVHALALRYRDGSGRRCHEAAYIDDMSLWHSLGAIAALPALHVELHACGLVVGAGSSRRVAARLAHAAVRERVCGATGRDAREETALLALHAQLIER